MSLTPRCPWIPALCLLLFAGCGGGSAQEAPPATYPDVDRESRIPADAIKITPETDEHPPILHSDEFHEPVPMDYPVNTAGGEDSPYLLPDGQTLYFWFTPDVSLPAEQQVGDDVTGIYVTERVGGFWEKPTRVWLQDPGRLSLDGAPTVVGDLMYFAAAREGYTGLNWFTARLVDGVWRNWTYAGDRLRDLEVGELHVVGDDLYFHSERAGGLGGIDVWKTTSDGATWSDPVHVAPVNTATTDGWPWVSADGQEMWITRAAGGAPSVWRARKVADVWQAPELIVSNFAGEPTLDAAGNLIFVHHFYKDDVMLEADLYVCLKK